MQKEVHQSWSSLAAVTLYTSLAVEQRTWFIHCSTSYEPFLLHFHWVILAYFVRFIIREIRELKCSGKKNNLFTNSHSVQVL